MSTKNSQNETIFELDWAKAKAHFDEVRGQYIELVGTPGVNTSLALAFTFQPLADRYDAGERTVGLYNQMTMVE